MPRERYGLFRPPGIQRVEGFGILAFKISVGVGGQTGGGANPWYMIKRLSAKNGSIKASFTHWILSAILWDSVEGSEPITL